MMKNGTRKEKIRRGLIIAFFAVVTVVAPLVVIAINMRENDSAGGVDVVMSEETRDTLATYQSLIDNVDSEDALVNLLMERMNYIISIDVSYSYGDIAIADAVRIDEIVQSLETAGIVVNVAASYGKNELADEYLTIMAVRQNIIEGIVE